jgi:hypothetical protein
VDRQRLSLALAAVLLAIVVAVGSAASPASGFVTHPDSAHEVAFADHTDGIVASRSTSSIRPVAHAGRSDRLTALMVWIAVVAVYAALCMRVVRWPAAPRMSWGTTPYRRGAPSRAPPTSLARLAG